MSGSRLYRPFLAALVALLAAALGCSGPDASEVEAKRPKKSIFKQRTQEVGEFDAKAGKELSDSKVKVTNPLLAGLEAYGPAAEKVTKLAIQHHLNIYDALHGHYPKDHEEFMREIIKKHKEKWEAERKSAEQSWQQLVRPAVSARLRRGRS